MNRNSIRFLVLLAIGILLAAGCTSPAEPKPPQHIGRQGTLTGTVVDANSGLKLWSGTVEIPGVAKTTIKDGTFTLENLPYGTYAVTISRDFYSKQTVPVVIKADSTTVEVKMQASFTKAELDLLARLVHAEAKGEPYKGQVAVAATVLNRLRHPDYPDTITGVINQVIVTNGRRYYQYEPVLNGSIHQPAGELAVSAVWDALAGWDPSLGATGFFAPAKVGSGSWVRTRPVTITIGNHRFFK